MEIMQSLEENKRERLMPKVNSREWSNAERLARSGSNRYIYIYIYIARERESYLERGYKRLSDDEVSSKEVSNTFAKILQEAKESAQFMGEEVKQMEAKFFSYVAKELQRVVDSCMNIAEFKILNQDCANQVQGHPVVEIEGGQLRLNFPQNSIQVNKKGKNAEVHNQEMIVQEKQGNEEELKQMEASLDQKHRLIWEAIANELRRVVDSCKNKAPFNILNQDCANQIQGHHVVEKEGGQLRLNFPQNSIQVNQKGKNAEVHNQEMTVQEKQGNEVILTLQQVEERLAGLKLAMEITNQDMKDLPTENSLNLESISREGVTAINLDEDTATNEANVKLSPETFIVQRDKVFKRNADVLDELFKERLKTAKNFRVACPNLQSHSLAGVYQKIIEDIKSMELMVQDMEHNGLQLTWLNEMLKEVHENLEEEQEKRKLEEEIAILYGKKKEAERRLAKLKKKPRLE